MNLPKLIKLTNKEKKLRLKRIKVTGVVLFSVIFIAIMFQVIDNTVLFFRENTIVKYKPITIKFQKPIEIISLTEMYRRQEFAQMVEDITDLAIDEYINPKTPVKCKQDTPQINANTFFETLREKESSNGENTNPMALHNYCKNKSLWNEIGYSPQNKFCFKDMDEARLYIAYYIKKNCDGRTFDECQCFYNTGIMTESCHYSKGELSLAN